MNHSTKKVETTSDLQTLIIVDHNLWHSKKIFSEGHFQNVNGFTQALNGCHVCTR